MGGEGKEGESIVFPKWAGLNATCCSPAEGLERWASKMDSVQQRQCCYGDGLAWLPPRLCAAQ